MERPKTLKDLEKVYESMNRHLQNPDSWTADFSLKGDLIDTRKCLCIFTKGTWKLHSYTWNRLLHWFMPLLPYGILYGTEGNGYKGTLHFTLHQCSGFSTVEPITHSGHFLAELLQQLAGLQILFRGLIVTPTGIALRGFPATEHQLKSLTNVRNRLKDAFQQVGIPFQPPYINDICHSTLFRWTIKPPKDAISYIQNSIGQWDESLLAEIRPCQWSFGYGSLRMLPQEITELCSYWTPLRIAHRGLTNGPNSFLENNIDTVRKRCELGLHSEIDIWFKDGQYWIGHDAPQKVVGIEFLADPSLWIHAKDAQTFYQLQRVSNDLALGLRIFYHTDEDYVLTTLGETIIYPGLPDQDGWLYMMPERSVDHKPLRSAYICSDFAT